MRRPFQLAYLYDEEIIRRYAAGESCHTIAESLPMHHTTVLRRLHANGVQVRRYGGSKKRTPHRESDAWRRMYQAGLTCSEIGELCGKAHNTVWLRLHEAGVKTRSSGESTRTTFARRKFVRSWVEMDDGRFERVAESALWELAEKPDGFSIWMDLLVFQGLAHRHPLQGYRIFSLTPKAYTEAERWDGRLRVRKSISA
jgi:transposase-like protein